MARAFNDRMVTAVLRAAGAEVEIPDPEQAMATFDEALIAEPETVDTEQDVMLRGLGLKRG